MDMDYPVKKQVTYTSAPAKTIRDSLGKRTDVGRPGGKMDGL